MRDKIRDILLAAPASSCVGSHASPSWLSCIWGSSACHFCSTSFIFEFWLDLGTWPDCWIYAFFSATHLSKNNSTTTKLRLPSSITTKFHLPFTLIMHSELQIFGWRNNTFRKRYNLEKRIGNSSQKSTNNQELRVSTWNLLLLIHIIYKRTYCNCNENYTFILTRSLRNTSEKTLQHNQNKSWKVEILPIDQNQVNRESSSWRFHSSFKVYTTF